MNEFAQWTKMTKASKCYNISSDPHELYTNWL